MIYASMIIISLPYSRDDRMAPAGIFCFSTADWQPMAIQIEEMVTWREFLLVNIG